MDIFFTDPDDMPVPPEEVRIRELEARPYPDGRRVAVRLHVTPFLKRPNMEVTIRNARGEEAANLNVVEAIESHMDFTMHLREEMPEGNYTLALEVFYADLEDLEEKAPGETTAGEILQKARNVVDQMETSFEISARDN